MKTKYIYGNISLESNLQISEKTYLNKIYIFSNNLKNKIEENLDKILGEDSAVIKRNTSSEILAGYQKKLLKTLE